MKAKKRFQLALVGIDSLRSREVKGILGRKKRGSFDLEFFDPEVREAYSNLAEFKEEPEVIHGPASGGLDGKDLVFLAADRQTNRAIDLGRVVASEGRPKDPAAAPHQAGARGAARRRRKT